MTATIHHLRLSRALASCANRRNPPPGPGAFPSRDQAGWIVRRAVRELAHLRHATPAQYSRARAAALDQLRAGRSLAWALARARELLPRAPRRRTPTPPSAA